MAQVDRFQHDASIPVFLISLKAGGTGLNLTGADMVVHFDPGGILLQKLRLQHVLTVSVRNVK